MHVELARAPSQSDRTGNRYRSRGTTRILMGDPSFVARNPDQLLGIVTKQQPNRSRPHGGSVARVGRGRARFFPGNACDQAPGSVIGCQATTHDAVFREDGSDSSGVIRGVETLERRVAHHELARQLRIVGVLAKWGVDACREGLLCTASAQPFHVGSTHLHRESFHGKSKRITETLPHQAAAKLFFSLDENHRRALQIIGKTIPLSPISYQSDFNVHWADCASGFTITISLNFEHLTDILSKNHENVPSG